MHSLEPIVIHSFINRDVNGNLRCTGATQMNQIKSYNFGTKPQVYNDTGISTTNCSDKQKGYRRFHHKACCRPLEQVGSGLLITLTR